jgi:hypothetical protein
MQHSAKCLAQQAKMKRPHDEYVEKWPNYCRECGGVGEVTWQENQSPLGSGMVWLETIVDLCDSCFGNGKCPRCGELNDEDLDVELYKCQHCGWEFATRDSGCPPAGLEEPCECYLPPEPDDEIPF